MKQRCNRLFASVVHVTHGFQMSDDNLVSDQYDLADSFIDDEAMSANNDGGSDVEATSVISFDDNEDEVDVDAVSVEPEVAQRRPASQKRRACPHTIYIVHETYCCLAQAPVTATACFFFFTSTNLPLILTLRASPSKRSRNAPIKDEEENVFLDSYATAHKLPAFFSDTLMPSPPPTPSQQRRAQTVPKSPIKPPASQKNALKPSSVASDTP